MAFCVALCNVACGSDDNDSEGNGGNNNNKGATIPAPPKADNAVAYEIPSGKMTAKSKDLKNDEGNTISADLTRVNITESEKAIVEVTTTDVNSKRKKYYATFDATLSGDTYTISDNGEKVGIIKKASATRGNEDLYVSLKFKINGITGVLEFEALDPIQVKAYEALLGSSPNLISIARTWYIERMKLVFVFDNKSSDASVIVEGGNLSEFIKLADDNDVSLSAKERADLNKDIKSITLDKNGQFTLTYTNGGTDVADWNWVSGTNEAKLQIHLKENEMGNKFLADNSQVEVQFYPATKQILLIMTTRLESDKCTASLLINLK